MKTRLLTILTLGLLAGPITAQAAPVLVGSNEWRQLTDTINLPLNSISTVCDLGTGLCSGSIGAVSFDGWRWADRNELQAFIDFAPSLAPFSFNATGSNSAVGSYRTAGSYTRGCLQGQSNGTFTGSFVALDGSEFVPVECFKAVNPTEGAPKIGVWLYRPAAVPEPSTLALLAMGLAGLGFARGRKA